MRRGWIDASVRCQLPAFSSTTTPHRLPGTTADAHTGVSCSPSTPANLRASLRVAFTKRHRLFTDPSRIESPSDHEHNQLQVQAQDSYSLDSGDRRWRLRQQHCSSRGNCTVSQHPDASQLVLQNGDLELRTVPIQS